MTKLKREAANRRFSYNTYSSLNVMNLKTLICILSGWLISTITYGDDFITLGAAVSLTGIYATSGQHTQNGYDLTVERINERGGIKVRGKDYKLRIIYYDDESDLARAAQLAEKLITKDKVDFLLGPYGSGLTEAMAPVAERHKVPMIEGNGAASSLFTYGYQYLFAVLTTADNYLVDSVSLLAQEAARQGRDAKSLRLALAVAEDPFSLDVRRGVVEAAKKYGMRVVVDDKLPPSLDDMRATLAKVKAIKPDLLVVSGYSKGLLTAAMQLERFRLKVPMIAATHCDAAAVAAKYPRGADYMLCAVQWHKDLAYKDDDGLFGGGEDFVRLFDRRYGYEPPYQAAQAAAAVQVWADAFRRAQSLDREELRAAIAATDMETFYGKVKFDDKGRNIAKAMVLTQIINGQYVVVSPTQWAEAKVVYPRPEK